MICVYSLRMTLHVSSGTSKCSTFLRRRTQGVVLCGTCARTSRSSKCRTACPEYTRVFTPHLHPSCDVVCSYCASVSRSSASCSRGTLKSPRSCVWLPRTTTTRSSNFGTCASPRHRSRRSKVTRGQSVDTVQSCSCLFWIIYMVFVYAL